MLIASCPIGAGVRLGAPLGAWKGRNGCRSEGAGGMWEGYRMRKLLLASAAMLGATSGIASAQTPSMAFQPSQGMMVGPSSPKAIDNSGNNTVAQPRTFQGYTHDFFGAVPAPEPGTVVIRLDGRVEVDMDAFSTTSNNSVAAGGGYNGFKINPVSFAAYMRLYPAIDGMATNGLRYGAAVELRENFNNPNAQASAGATTAGGVQPIGIGGAQPAAGTAVAAAVSPSGNSSAQTVFVRRAFTYIAADNVGIVRFGQTDGVIGLFDPCIFSAACWGAGISPFNGDMIQAQGPQNAVGIPFPWLAQAGAEYGNVKIVYLSPQFFGLEVGVQYAPSMGNGFANGTSANAQSLSLCAQAGPNCISTTTGADGTRWFNQVAVGGRWQGTFGPVQTGLMAVYETAGKESVFGAPIKSGGPGRVLGNTYDNLSFVEAAGYATLDTSIGKVTASVDWIGGALNGQLQMRPSGGVPESAIVTGLLYTNGAITMGAEAAWVWSQGAQQLTGISQRGEFEVAFGGNYNLAPGLFLVAEYMYQQRHQGGFDFGAGAVSPNGLTRDARAQGVLFATVVNW
jgi:hypothetical protein